MVESEAARAHSGPPGASFSLGRSLFAKTPPSIVITEPLPRWRVWVQQTLRGAALLLSGAVCFYAGVLYERSQAQRPAVVVQADVPQGAPAAAQPSIRLPALAEVMDARALEGLDIQGLQIVVDRLDPAQLRYQFAVLNEGRRYEGTLEFLVLGVQDGQPTSWIYPPQAQRGEARFQMRVGRYVKTEGTIPLPAGLKPQAVAVRLREAEGIRASRGVMLEPAQPAAAR
jgi:hypothetical protein